MSIRQDRVGDLVFSPGGGRLAFIVNDRQRSVWQTQIRRSDGRGEPMILAGQSAVLGLAWSPDGDHLATASADGSARIWRVSWRALVDYLASATRVCLTPEERSRYLDEPLAEARLAFQVCESSHGRDPLDLGEAETPG